MSDLRDVNSYLLLHGASESLMLVVERAMRVEKAAQGPARYCAAVANAGWPRCPGRYEDRDSWCGFCLLAEALDGDSVP